MPPKSIKSKVDVRKTEDKSDLERKNVDLTYEEVEVDNDELSEDGKEVAPEARQPHKQIYKRDPEFHNSRTDTGGSGETQQGKGGAERTGYILDSEKYRKLNDEKFKDIPSNELLNILMVRGLDNQNPTLFNGARTIYCKLNFEKFGRSDMPDPLNKYGSGSRPDTNRPRYGGGGGGGGGGGYRGGGGRGRGSGQPRFRPDYAKSDYEHDSYTRHDKTENPLSNNDNGNRERPRTRTTNR